MKTLMNNLSNNSINTNSVKTTTMKTQMNTVTSSIRKAAAIFTTVLALATAPIAMAASGPGPEAAPLQSSVFQLPNSMKFKTVVAPSESGKLSISIAKNVVIYSESIKNNPGYIRTFDFATLEDGEYTFEISNGKQTDSKTFKIETTTARVVNLN
jgi:hypothetical protein